MHINYYCIPETSILSSISGTITSSSLGQPVYLQSPGFNNEQKIPCGENLVCSVETSGNGSTVSIIIWQIVLENKWDQCNQTLIVKRSDDRIIYEWQCQDNTATPEILQTTERYLKVHLENTLPDDLGSFWLGFAGSSPDSRVTVSCTSETKPCPDLSAKHSSERQKDIGIVVGGVAGFGFIVFILSIVFIRRRINERKAYQNANSKLFAQIAFQPRLSTIGGSNGPINPIYASISSNSTYGLLGRIAGERGFHSRPKNPFRNTNS